MLTHDELVDEITSKVREEYELEIGECISWYALNKALGAVLADFILTQRPSAAQQQRPNRP